MSGNTTKYTPVDIRAAMKFAQANTNIRYLNALNNVAPHIVSHLKYEFIDATHEDYYIPLSIKHACKILKIEISEKVCEMLSCNKSKENDLCKPEDVASYYHVGDDKYDLQCQPACFHLKPTTQYTTDGKITPQTPMLSYHDGHCRYVPEPIISYLEKTFYRSKNIYEKRVNDMPTGFSRIVSENQFGCGFDYKFNKSYCGYYDLDLLNNGGCGESWLGFVGDSLIGMHFINAVKSVPRLIFNNNKPFDLPKDTIKLPTSIPINKTIEGWKRDINKDFVIPELIDTTPHTINVNDVSNKRQEMEFLYHNNLKTEDPVNLNVSDDWLDKLSEALTNGINDLNLLEQIALQLGLDFVAQKALKMIVKKLSQLSAVVTKLLAEEMIILVRGVGSHVIAAAIRATATQAIIKLGLGFAGKAAIYLSTMLISAVSVIGWVLFIAMFIDIILTFWDPLNYNKILPKTQPHDMMEQGENALRMAMGDVSANYTFDMLVSAVLDEATITKIQVQSFEDVLNYLNALTVNSEGTYIDKGPIINLNGNKNDYVTAQNKAIAKQMRFNPKTFREYNKSFFERTVINKYLLNSSVLIGSISIALVSLKVYLLAFVFIILFLVSLCLLKNETQYSMVFNMLKKLNVKINMQFSI